MDINEIRKSDFYRKYITVEKESCINNELDGEVAELVCK
jgi:hypothetical protein